MSDSPTSEPESNFVCDCKSEVISHPMIIQEMLSACAGQPFYGEHDGRRYCVLHYPSMEKKEDFDRVVQQKLDVADFNFAGVWFPDAPFESLIFDADVNFSSAHFDAKAYAFFAGARFNGNANFGRAQFKGSVYFGEAQFSADAYFDFAHFSEEATFFCAEFNGNAYFYCAEFNGNAIFDNAKFSADAHFSHAQFREGAGFYSVVFNTTALFYGTRFIDDNSHGNSAIINNNVSGTDDALEAKVKTNSVCFDGANFNDGVIFKGTEFADQVFLSFSGAIFEKPERVIFHTAPLRPHWFINVDPREFTFIDVRWRFLNNQDAIREEIEALRRSKKEKLSRLLELTFRHLAVNAEENNRYDEASRFRYLAMDARRLESWRGFAPWKLSWWYWLTSGYGERVLQAFLVLLGIWFVAGLLYTRAGFARWEPKLASESDVIGAKRDDVGAPLKFSRALTYSVGVMTLQKPEPRPATTAAQTVVLLETILGPVQAALLALAIRRKFMR